MTLQMPWIPPLLITEPNKAQPIAMDLLTVGGEGVCCQLPLIVVTDTDLGKYQNPPSMYIKDGDRDDGWPTKNPVLDNVNEN